jgi:O-acetylhomoserine (thiol)-lyase
MVCTASASGWSGVHGVERVALDAQDVADFHGGISWVLAPGVQRGRVNIAHNAATPAWHAPGRTLHMAGYFDPGFDTLALHAGAAPDPATGARAVPIHLSTSFVFESSEHAASPVQHGTLGPCLQPHQQPHQRGAGRAHRRAGRRLRAPSPWPAARPRCTWPWPRWPAPAPHRGQQRAVRRQPQPADYTLARFGISTTFVKPGDVDAWRAAIRPNTKLLFGETLGNPGLDVLDIPTVSAIAHDAGLPLLVDSTFTTPWLMKPFDHGADLVFHSATKFLSGHGTVVGGVLVDSGAFDWAASGRFPELSEPYDGFHGMVFSEESTVGAFLLRARREGLRDFGACMSPHTAWLILQGIETCRCAWRATWRTHARSSPSWPRTRWWRAWATPNWKATPATRWRRSCCRAAAARCSAST